MKLFYELKQTKTNIKKYFDPISLNHHICAHMQCQEPKKGQQKVQILKKTAVLWPFRRYYSIMGAGILLKIWVVSSFWVDQILTSTQER